MSRRSVSRSPSPRTRSPQPDYDAGDDVVNNTPNDEVPLTPSRSRTPSRSSLDSEGLALGAGLLGGSVLGASTAVAASPSPSVPQPATSVRTGAVSRSPVVSRSRSRSLREEDPELYEEEPELVSSVLPEEVAAPPATIDDHLRSLGYVPLSQGKVVSNGELKYVKAHDLYGNTVYIDVDELNPSVSVGQADLSYTETIPTETPLEDVLSRAEGIQLSVPGVVYECQDGICTIRREAKTYDLKATQYTRENAAPGSMTLVTPGSRRLSSLQHAYDGKSPLPHPIVKLSDIELNPTLVRKNTETACLRFRSQLMFQEEKRQMLFKAKLDLFYAKSLEALNDLSIARKNIIEKADLLKKRLFDITPVCEKTKAAYMSTLQDLCTCNTIFEGYFDKTYTYTRIHEGIEARTLEIQKLQKDLVARYC